MTAENPNRTGNRPSSLAIARLCGLAPVLGRSSGASRSALVSSACHALWSDAPEAPELMAKLTDEEREAIGKWKKPKPIDVRDAAPVGYDGMVKEVYVSCDEYALWVSADRPHLNGGTIDFCFVFEFEGRRIVFIGDLKRTRWSSSEGPNGMQLAAYGFAACAQFDADGYLPAFWYLEDAEWNIGDVVWMGTPQARAKWKELLVALRNRDGRAVTGDYCDSCWERSHCPEYLALGLKGNEATAKVLRGDDVTPAEALEALVAFEAQAKAAELGRDRLKAMVKASEVEIRNGKGKRWLPVIMPGRKRGPSVEECERLGHGSLVKQGPEYEQMKWINGK